MACRRSRLQEFDAVPDRIESEGEQTDAKQQMERARGPVPAAPHQRMLQGEDNRGEEEDGFGVGEIGQEALEEGGAVGEGKALVPG